MTQDEIIEQLRGMAKYPTVTLPRDCEALRMAADLLAQPDYTITQTGVGIGQRAEEAYEAAKERGWEGLSDHCLMQNAQGDIERITLVQTGVGIGKPEQEPVIDQSAAVRIATALGWTPQRKPLTDEEIEKMRHLIDWTAAWSYINFARAIEAAYGVKE